MKKLNKFNLKHYGIDCDKIYHNLPLDKIYELAKEHGAKVSDKKALVIYSGTKTGRSPKDKRIVKNPESENDIWWGKINIPLSQSSFDKNKNLAIKYLSHEKELFVFDGYAGADKKHQIKVRVICTEPYHALFMNNMLIRATDEELKYFSNPDYVIYNAGKHPADTSVEGVESNTSVSISFESKEIVILGTRYAGEMKKGIFTVMNYLMPKEGIMSMHCSANEGDGVSLFFGLSGTGKTTLSTDPKRYLIGDDEHCWTEDSIFNIEGGCYAKCIDLSREQEPEIYDAIKYGTVIENVVLNDQNQPQYQDKSITENTRAAYPVDFIPNAKIPGIGDIPKNIIFLTCDAFGILPPVSKLTRFQASYHFISGYTAKVAGTEIGVTEPQVSFSACFGEPFMVWHPNKYATFLAEKIKKHNVTAWLINTGWIGGAYGVGERIKLKYTRAIIDAIHSGELVKANTSTTEVFKFVIPTVCSGVPTEVLNPKNFWKDKKAYDKKRKYLSNLFNENFKKFENEVTEEIRAAGPEIS